MERTLAPEQLTVLRMVSQYRQQGLSRATLESRTGLKNADLIASSLVQLRLLRHDPATKVDHVTELGLQALRQSHSS